MNLKHSEITYQQGKQAQIRNNGLITLIAMRASKVKKASKSKTIPKEKKETPL